MDIVAEATFDPEKWLAADPNRQYLQVPLVKSWAKDDGGWTIEGVASCEEVDADADRVLQKGMDTSPLIASGYFNWDHRDRDGPGYLIGMPKEALIAPASDFREQLGKSIDGLAFYVRGDLFEHNDKPVARQVWNHLQAMHDLKIPNRGLGFSVQGQILERDRFNPRLVVKSVCRQLAITHQPKQAYTFARLAKSFATDANLHQSMTTATAAPLRRENFGKEITDLLFGECKHGCLNQGGEFQKGIRSAVQHLVLCKGYPLDESSAVLETLVKSGITRRPFDS